jgi:hypothetical protein
MLECQTCSHIYEWLGNVLSAAVAKIDNDEDTGVQEETPPTAALEPTRQPADDDSQAPGTWKSPDLQPGSQWYADRVVALADACKGIKDRERWFRRGLGDLDRHRRNYQGKGIKELQLLWWQFPSEHWKELREGCSMSLTEPVAKSTPNAPMDDTQRELAGAFMDELDTLGAVQRVAKGRNVV